MTLKGISALVTGSSKGIGAATAKALADEGAQVTLHYSRDHKSAQTVLESLSGKGHHMVQADLSTAAGALKLFEQCLAHNSRIQVLVNNAGIFQMHDLATTTDEEFQKIWNETMQVNLHSPARLSFLFAKHMATQGGGRIINISSRGAFRGEPMAPAYGASKAGLNALSQSMAQAFASQGVDIFVVAPGFVETAMARPHLRGAAGDAIKNQSPLKRVAFVEEIAETVLFLASKAPSYMTGAILDINGASYLRS